VTTTWLPVGRSPELTPLAKTATTLTGPVPSSTSTPKPSASVVRPAWTTPSTRMRRPSHASRASPVAMAGAEGSARATAGSRSEAEATRRMRWP